MSTTITQFINNLKDTRWKILECMFVARKQRIYIYVYINISLSTIELLDVLIYTFNNGKEPNTHRKIGYTNFWNTCNIHNDYNCHVIGLIAVVEKQYGCV